MERGRRHEDVFKKVRLLSKSQVRDKASIPEPTVFILQSTLDLPLHCLIDDHRIVQALQTSEFWLHHSLFWVFLNHKIFCYLWNLSGSKCLRPCSDPECLALRLFPKLESRVPSDPEAEYLKSQLYPKMRSLKSVSLAESCFLVS